jgi:hypothetical protein
MDIGIAASRALCILPGRSIMSQLYYEGYAAVPLAEAISEEACRVVNQAISWAAGADAVAWGGLEPKSHRHSPMTTTVGKTLSRSE